jgi:hypothetical protein
MPYYLTVFSSPHPTHTQWYGVHLDGAGHVSKLDLRSNCLKGKHHHHHPHPPLLLCFPSLTLSSRNACPPLPSPLPPLLPPLCPPLLAGKLPAALSLLSSLQQLDIYNNPVSGSVPPEFGALLCLRDLYLGKTELRIDRANLQALLPHCRLRL